MKTTIRAVLLSLTGSALMAALPARAHHSFPAQYDVKKPVSLTGKVTKVEWTNPHIFIHMEVPDAQTGQAAAWTLELGGPNQLLRLGWKRDSLKTGDLITAEGSRARDGSNLAHADSIVMVATGKKMFAGPRGGTSPSTSTSTSTSTSEQR